MILFGSGLVLVVDQSRNGRHQICEKTNRPPKAGGRGNF